MGGNTVLIFPGVALLPFVDERRLRAALEEVYPDLTPEESKNWGVELKNWGIFLPPMNFTVNEHTRCPECLVGLNLWQTLSQGCCW